MALSDVKIRKAEIRDKPYKLSDGGGLFVLVKPNGSKLWQQKYRHFGKERLLSHGQYPEVTLAQARKKRDEARAQVANGIDPAVQKRLDQIEAETQSRTTFHLVAEEYLQMAILQPTYFKGYFTMVRTVTCMISHLEVSKKTSIMDPIAAQLRSSPEFGLTNCA